ncbi:MAG: cell division protein ZapE, partial [Rhodocyclaceae bacterium]|nr:cell division protein ZapE [Rhodocyclaceae bacterium]
QHHTLLLSGLPVLAPTQSNAARRFTWLVDVLYDHRVKFILSAAAQPQEIYVAGPSAHEFVRTVSRMVEMRTREYLAEAHRVDS